MGQVGEPLRVGALYRRRGGQQQRAMALAPRLLLASLSTVALSLRPAAAPADAGGTSARGTAAAAILQLPSAANSSAWIGCFRDYDPDGQRTFANTVMHGDVHPIQRSDSTSVFAVSQEVASRRFLDGCSRGGPYPMQNTGQAWTDSYTPNLFLGGALLCQGNPETMPTNDALKTDDTHGRPWSGPHVKVMHPNGIAQLSIDGKPHPATWLTIKLDGSYFKPGKLPLANNTDFDAEISAAASTGERLVAFDVTNDCCLAAYGERWAFSPSNPIPAGVKAAFDRAIELHPTILFILRFVAQSSDLPNVAFMNATNDTDRVVCPGVGHFPPHSSVCNPMNTVTPHWANVTSARLQTMLVYMDRLFPGRIAGVNPNALHTSEWMLMAESAFDWMPDYSDAQQQAYCASQGKKVGCSVPLPSSRVVPAFNDSFANPAAAELSFWQAANMADAIAKLAKAAKQASGGNIFTFSFHGYDLMIAERLLHVPELDGICSTYDYVLATRNITVSGCLLDHPEGNVFLFRSVTS